MKCPRDSSELQAFRIMESDIYSCGTCQGAWIPFNVIREVTRSVALTKVYPTKLNSTPSGIPCPRDGEDLREHTAQGVRIDQCPKCNGIWLDEGELQQLRDYQAKLTPSLPSDTTAPNYTLGDTVSSVVGGALVVLVGLFDFTDD